MELEPSAIPFTLRADPRKRMEQPILVLLEAVADMHLPTPRVTSDLLDTLYVAILLFKPLAVSPHLVYQADNFVLRFDLPPQDRSDYRPVRIIVPSLADVQRQFIELEIEYTPQKGLAPGHECLVLQDPAGNWLEIREHREIG